MRPTISMQEDRPSKLQIEERMPSWLALSELFLDTELDAKDYDRIAAVLAASRYSEQEIYDILIYEVYPVCRWNMLSVAGEWSGFDPEWIKEKMTPFYDKRPWFFHVFGHRWMFGRPWKRICPRISEIRQTK